MLSYALVRLRAPKDQTSFEGWVAARFGWRLYRIFSKTYTEEVWGVPAMDIKADWAAERAPSCSRAATDCPHPPSSWVPIPDLVRARHPPPPPHVLEAASGLPFPDFLTVALVVPVTAGLPDNWICIHEPDVRVGRVQNFGSWDRIWSRTASPAWVSSTPSRRVTTCGTPGTRG